MATKKDSQVEKSEDLVQEVNVGKLLNAEDPVKEVILAVMKILLWEEERALVSDINEYCNNLSRHLLNRLSELKDRPTWRDLCLVLRLVARSGRSRASSERNPPLPYS